MFEKILSVDEVKRYEPARETYEYAPGELGVATDDILLVAAHVGRCWRDGRRLRSSIRGASPGKSLNPLVKKPDFVVKDLNELVRKLK